MKFGVNTPLVDEVIQLAQDRLIFAKYTDAASTWTRIYDLQDAEQLAWHATFGDNEYTWSDIREREIAEANSRGYYLPKQVQDALEANLTTLTRLIQPQLDEKYIELFDDIVGDLYNCALNRAVHGASGFYEEVFRAYRSGGWPCGWDGNYPDGRLAVYYPA